MSLSPSSSTPVFQHDEVAASTKIVESPSGGTVPTTGELHVVDIATAPESQKKIQIATQQGSLRKRMYAVIGSGMLAAVLGIATWSQWPKDDANVKPDPTDGKAGKVSPPGALKAPERAPDSGAASAPELDWISRLLEGRGKLGSATPPGLTPSPAIPGKTVPSEFR